MSPYILIITLAMSSYDGGAAVQSIPFVTWKACQDAAQAWNKRDIGNRWRTTVTAICHPTGAPG